MVCTKAVVVVKVVRFWLYIESKAKFANDLCVGHNRKKSQGVKSVLKDIFEILVWETWG